MKQGLEKIIEDNRSMQHDLSVAQRIIHEKDKRLNEQEKLIMALGEEVKAKEAL